MRKSDGKSASNRTASCILSSKNVIFYVLGRGGNHTKLCVVWTVMLLSCVKQHTTDKAFGQPVLEAFATLLPNV